MDKQLYNVKKFLIYSTNKPKVIPKANGKTTSVDAVFLRQTGKTMLIHAYLKYLTQG